MYSFVPYPKALSYALLVCLSCSSAFAADPAPSQAAAKVNGHVISLQKLDHEIERQPMLAMQKAQAKGNPEALKELQKSALDRIISRELLLDAALKSSSVDEKAVEQSVNGVIAQYGGEEKLAELLPSIKTTLKEFRQEVANDFRIRQYLDKQVKPKSDLAESDVKKAFEANPDRFAQPELVHARHILIKVDPQASPEDSAKALERINELYKRASAPGADFAALAKENSDCPSAERGGDLGQFPKGAMVPEFEQVAFSAKPGEVSKPIKTQFGYHLIKVETHSVAQKPDFARAKPMIESDLRAKQQAAAVEAHVSELRTKAKVEILL
jgi:peptidyl-prolyl cis-trans isomerase C